MAEKKSLCQQAGVDYDDHRIERESWPELKPSESFRERAYPKSSPGANVIKLVIYRHSLVLLSSFVIKH
jgi:hypothetical protein